MCSSTTPIRAQVISAQVSDSLGRLLLDSELTVMLTVTPAKAGVQGDQWIPAVVYPREGGGLNDNAHTDCGNKDAR